MSSWSKMSKALFKFGEKQPENWKKVRQRQEVRFTGVSRGDIAKWPTDEKSEQRDEVQEKIAINQVHNEAQLKNLAMKEEQMRKLDKEKDETLRIYKNASEKKHSGKSLTFGDQHIDADCTILEWKALGFTVIGEVSNTALSAVNSAIDIAKAVPSVVSDIARAVENLGTFGSAPTGAPPKPESGGQTEIANPAAFPDASDPAFGKAYKIDELASRLGTIIKESLEKGIEQSTRGELLNCLKDIKNCKVSLEAEKRETRPSQDACDILGDCEKVCSILSFNIARPHACRSSKTY